MSSKISVPDRHHIYEYETTWLFQIRYKGKPLTKNFNFNHYGGKDKALVAAKSYRDNFILENKIELNKRFKKSEIKGVSLTYDKQKSGNKPQYWQAVGFEKNKQFTKRFAVNKYGFDKAKQLAIEARKTFLSNGESGESRLFIAPANENIKLWRYMDFTKFVYMLEKSALFFSKVGLLGDPYEGEFSRGNKKIRKFVYSRAADKQDFQSLEDEIKKIRNAIVVNCWHINKSESAAMWKLYSKSNEAICIQTTFKKFKRALPAAANIGQVKYIDYESEWIPESDLYYPFIYKRNSFEHEHELRGLIDLTKIDQTSQGKIEVIKDGAWVRVHMSNLIEAIYVAPDSPDWFKDLVECVKNRYNLKRKTVIKSRVLYKPFD